MPLTPHTIVDRYEILASIGAGGMGEVYRARDSRLNRDVAIKVLPDSYSSVPDRLRRFEQEARAAAALNHSNILAVYELGTYKGAPYLVSELLEGETLRERLENGPLPLRKVIDYGAQIARGLAAAHEKGIIHRDLKPENLFLTKDGQVKILDFGLARIVRPNDGTPAFADQPDLTDPDLVMGTVGYMSPDQVRGRLADARSDIFSLSAILHEMLTGQRAFQKSTAAETMSAILNEDPLSLAHHAPNTPIALQKIIHRGLEKNPEQRFQSASDLAFALDALSDLTLLSSQSGYQHLDKKPSKLVPALVVAAIFFLVLASFLSYLYNRPIPIPNVSNYEQLTHDGEQKSIIGTDGSRLYLSLITSAVQEVAAVENAGGELTKISMPGADMIPVGMSSDGSDFLVVEGKAFRQLARYGAYRSWAVLRAGSVIPWPQSPRGRPMPGSWPTATPATSLSRKPMEPNHASFYQWTARWPTSPGPTMAAICVSVHRRALGPLLASILSGMSQPTAQTFIACFPAGTARPTNAAAGGPETASISSFNPRDKSGPLQKKPASAAPIRSPFSSHRVLCRCTRPSLRRMAGSFLSLAAPTAENFLATT